MNFFKISLFSLFFSLPSLFSGTIYYLVEEENESKLASLLQHYEKEEKDSSYNGVSFFDEEPDAHYFLWKKKDTSIGSDKEWLGHRALPKLNSQYVRNKCLYSVKAYATKITCNFDNTVHKDVGVLLQPRGSVVNKWYFVSANVLGSQFIPSQPVILHT